MNIALVLAGGTGIRMATETPKQFFNVGGMPLVLYSLTAFNAHEDIDAIYIVCREDWQQKLNSLLKKNKINKFASFVLPGETRRESSFNGLAKIREACSDTDIVLIHDAARPIFDQRVISDCIMAAEKFGACTASIKCVDTVMVSKDGKTAHHISNRDELFYIQTPQAFRLGLIVEAHEKYNQNSELNVTDDCSLILELGKPVYFVEGDKRNIKVTTKEDLILLDAMLKIN